MEPKDRPPTPIVQESGPTPLERYHELARSLREHDAGLDRDPSERRKLTHELESLAQTFAREDATFREVLSEVFKESLEREEPFNKDTRWLEDVFLEAFRRFEQRG